MDSSTSYMSILSRRRVCATWTYTTSYPGMRKLSKATLWNKIKMSPKRRLANISRWMIDESFVGLRFQLYSIGRNKVDMKRCMIWSGRNMHGNDLYMRVWMGMGDKDWRSRIDSLELWCSWLSRLLYTQKVLGSNPSSSIFCIIIMRRTFTPEQDPSSPRQLTDPSE